MSKYLIAVDQGRATRTLHPNSVILTAAWTPHIVTI